MSKRRLFLAAILACLLSSAAVRAADTAAVEPPQNETTALLEAIRANRKALVAVNLALSPEEAAKFWPLYERYHKELNAIGDRAAALIADYIASFRDLSNEKALKLAGDYLEADAERAQLRSRYLSEFATILPGRTVARFYQIENKMDAVLRYDLAATIPVVEEQPPTPAK